MVVPMRFVIHFVFLATALISAAAWIASTSGFTWVLYVAIGMVIVAAIFFEWWFHHYPEEERRQNTSKFA